MPIGDLLAQISGDKAASGSAPSLQRSDSLPKRKAENGLRGDAPKIQRVNAPPSKPNQPSTQLNGANPIRRPSNGLSTGQTSNARSANVVHKVPERPGPPRPSGPSKEAEPRKAPKKGSFADILARGQRAQAVMGQVGRIQHKQVDKRPALKEREDSRIEKRPLGKRPTGSERTGDVDRRSNGVRMSRGPPKQSHTGLPARPVDARRGKAAEPEVEKKVKKAAHATTGYTGTARPKPGSSSKKDRTSRGGALLNAPAQRMSSAKRSSYDEYDEDLDDFIEYDEDEDEAGGPGYASDGSSDMEAGLDELDDEERRAEQIARREDIEEERLEKRLKLAKEDKKRKALEAFRAGRNR